MAETDYRSNSKTAKSKDLAMKGRPSIQMSLTLQKPVFIISKNLNGQHIQQLTDELDKNKISYLMQQETETLGFSLNQHFFVIVDNLYGELALGSEFGSPFMTIVGYPKIGRNKKTKYFERLSELIAYLKNFNQENNLKKQNGFLFQSNYHTYAQKGDKVKSNLKNKIEVKSICKYTQEKYISNSVYLTDKKKQNIKKLIILLDNCDKEYKRICQDLLKVVKQNYIQIVQSIQEIQQRVFNHNNEEIYYLVNEINSKQLIKVSSFGEIIIYGSSSVSIFINMIKEPKIYGIVYEQKQLIKILAKVGIQIVLQANIQKQTKLNKRETQPVGRQSAQSCLKQYPLLLKLQSKPNKNIVQDCKLKQSKLDHDKKIKMLKKGITPSNQKQIIPYVQVGKQNRQQFRKEDQVSIRKKTLKKEQCLIPKSKKNLTFSDNVDIKQNEVNYKKNVRQFDKIGPEEVAIQTYDCTTITENEYNTTNSSNQYSKKNQRKENSSIIKEKDYSFMLPKLQKRGTINGIFYRQFVPKFKELIQKIKKQPDVIFFQNHQNQVYYSFVYSHQYDRFTTGLKHKLKNIFLDQFNFLVFLEQEEVSQFMQYCQQKQITKIKKQHSTAHQKILNEHQNLGRQNIIINIHLFIKSMEQIEQKILIFGKTNIYLSKIFSNQKDPDYSETITKIHNKLLERRIANKADIYE